MAIKPGGGAPRAGAAAPATDSLPAGTVLGGCRLEALIGRGGMGAVYRATQLSLDRPVAVKVLAGALAARPDFRQRFLREASALARLSHPNIVSVIDRGEDAGRCYIVMELVEGRSLRGLMNERPIAPAEAVEIVRQVLAGLACAHGRGIVHRDIKPANLLVDAAGTLKIADFGIATGTAPEFAGTSALTATGMAIGTLSYMAPEQRIDARRADHRADLYAVGVLFYELLTGELPKSLDTPSARNPGVDPALDPIVAKAMKSDPTQRYQSADEISSDLDEVTGDVGRARVLLRRSRLALEEGDRPAARAFLDDARRALPDDSETRALERAIEADTDTVRVALATAVGLLKEGDLGAARRRVVQALDRHPESSELRGLLAEIAARRARKPRRAVRAAVWSLVLLVLAGAGYAAAEGWARWKRNEAARAERQEFEALRPALEFRPAAVATSADASDRSEAPLLALASFETAHPSSDRLDAVRAARERILSEIRDLVHAPAASAAAAGTSGDEPALRERLATLEAWTERTSRPEWAGRFGAEPEREEAARAAGAALRTELSWRALGEAVSWDGEAGPASPEPVEAIAAYRKRVEAHVLSLDRWLEGSPSGPRSDAARARIESLKALPEAWAWRQEPLGSGEGPAFAGRSADASVLAGWTRALEAFRSAFAESPRRPLVDARLGALATMPADLAWEESSVREALAADPAAESDPVVRKAVLEKILAAHPEHRDAKAAEALIEALSRREKALAEAAAARAAEDARAAEAAAAVAAWEAVRPDFEYGGSDPAACAAAAGRLTSFADAHSASPRAAEARNRAAEFARRPEEAAWKALPAIDIARVEAPALRTLRQKLFDFLSAFPDGVHRDEARSALKAVEDRLIDLAKAGVPGSSAPAPAPAGPPAGVPSPGPVPAPGPRPRTPPVPPAPRRRGEPPPVFGRWYQLVDDLAARHASIVVGDVEIERILVAGGAAGVAAARARAVWNRDFAPVFELLDASLSPPEAQEVDGFGRFYAGLLSRGVPWPDPRDLSGGSGERWAVDADTAVARLAGGEEVLYDFVARADPVNRRPKGLLSKVVFRSPAETITWSDIEYREIRRGEFVFASCLMERASGSRWRMQVSHRTATDAQGQNVRVPASLAIRKLGVAAGAVMLGDGWLFKGDAVELR